MFNLILLIPCFVAAGHLVVTLHRQGFWYEPVHCATGGLLLAWLTCYCVDCFAVQLLTLAVALFTAQLIWLGHQTPYRPQRRAQRASYRILEAVQCS